MCKLYALIVFYFLLVLSPAYADKVATPTHMKVLEVPATYFGVTFPAGSKVQLASPDDYFVAGWPSETITIRGVSVLVGSEVKLSDKAWSIAKTQAGQKIKDFIVPENAGVWLRADGSVKYIVSADVVHVGDLDISADIQGIYFYKNGNLKEIHLARDQIVGSIPLKGAKDHPTMEGIDFYESGKLMSGTLSANMRLIAHKDGQTDKPIDLLEGDKIYLDEQGRVIGIAPKKFGPPSEYHEERYPPPISGTED